MDIRALLRDVQFGYPDALILIYLWGTVALWWSILFVLQKIVRPRPTHGSRYAIIGEMKMWLGSLGMALCLIVSLADPFVPRQGASVQYSSVDVVFVVDTSFSMWASDMSPTRLDVVRNELYRLVSSGAFQEGDRVALFTFARISARKLHLSKDRNRLIEELSRLAPPQRLVGDLSFWGSDLVTVMNHAYASLDTHDKYLAGDPPNFKPRRSARRLLVLISDGDFDNAFSDAPGVQKEFESRLRAAILEYRQRGLAVYSIGAGTPGGYSLESILRRYQRGKDYTPQDVQDLSGQTTRLNMSWLEYVSRQTGGRSMTFSSPSQQIGARLKTFIDSHRTISFEVVSAKDRLDMWRWPLYASLILAFMLIALR